MVAPATGSDGKKRIAASLGPSACSWCVLFRCCGGFTPRNRLRKQLAMTHIAMCSCSSLRDCFGLSFLLCSAMAEEPPSAEETNRLAADILFACHILIENIQGYEALVPQELQQNFQLAGDVAYAAKRELEEVMEEPSHPLAAMRVQNAGEAVKCLASFLADELSLSVEDLLS